jgi:hypothetical protein
MHTKITRLLIAIFAVIALIIPFTTSVVSASAPDYKFTTINYPDAVSTGPWGINPRGDIVGFYYPGATALGFTLINGEFKSIDQGSNTTVISISASGEMVGDYQPNSEEAWHWHGFRIPKGGDPVPLVDPTGHTSIVPMRILNNGTIVGFVQSDSDNTTKHGIILRPDGSYTYYEGLPNSRHNGATPDATIITGWYTDGQAGANHGYVLDNGNLIKFNVPGCFYTMPTDIHPDGKTVVGTCIDLKGVHGFVAKRLGADPQNWNYTIINVPDSTNPGPDKIAKQTGIGGINANGDLVGNYVSADGVRHGYIATCANNYK